MTFGRGGGGSDALYGQADRVAWCESQHNPNAVNPRSGTSGLFQIHPKYHRTAFTQVTGQPWEKVFDPFWNAVYAKHLYDRLGWQPWVCKP